ncbi:MAG: hypothetical protein ACRC6A_09325 [Fusobacteriaceae bacterium]
MEIFMKFRATEEFRKKVKLLCKLKNKTISTLIREYFEKEFKKNKI